MNKRALLSVTAVAGLAVAALAGCSSNAAPGGDGSSAAPAGLACVILPDSTSSARYESLDRPALKDGLESAGFKTDIQNAQGDTQKYATIGDQLLAEGCGVMILDDYNGAAVAVAAKAKAQGVPVIAYDRSFTGADYYVSFDNEKVGELQGQGIVDALKAEGKDVATASIVYMGGDPSDNNAKMFHDGADKALKAAGLTKPAAEPAGVWDQGKTATNFEQALTSLSGKVDAVWVANDTNAAGVITVLQKNGLEGKVPVTGQDASVAGLQNVLLGYQTGTVWKHVQDEAKATTDLAIQILKGETPSVSDSVTLPDGSTLPFVSVVPVWVTAANVKDVVAAGDATVADLCTGDVAAACTANGVK